MDGRHTRKGPMGMGTDMAMAFAKSAKATGTRDRITTFGESRRGPSRPAEAPHNRRLDGVAAAHVPEHVLFLAVVGRRQVPEIAHALAQRWSTPVAAGSVVPGIG